MPATVEVEVAERWDALALYRRLIPYHAYLVQCGRERWLVHAAAPGFHGEQLRGALDAIEGCLADRHVQAAHVLVDGRPYRGERR